MSKKLTISLLLCTLLAGCQLFETNPDESYSMTESSSTSIASESQSTTSSATTETAKSETTVSTLLNEMAEQSPYPVATLPIDVPVDELNQAIESYYTENYSEEEKVANTSPISKETLRELQTYFNKNEQTKTLNIHVEQVTMTLSQQQVYITRLVVPYPLEEANDKLADSEIILTNEALAYLGNRLVYVTYYNPKTKQLTPVNLSNSQHPLYYNGD